MRSNAARPLCSSVPSGVNVPVGIMVVPNSRLAKVTLMCSLVSRLIVLCFTLAALVAPSLHAQAAASPALILDAVTNSKPLPDGLEVQAGAAILRITALRDDIIRVRIAPDALPEDASWAVLPEGAQVHKRPARRRKLVRGISHGGARGARRKKSSAHRDPGSQWERDFGRFRGPPRHLPPGWILCPQSDAGRRTFLRLGRQDWRVRSRRTGLHTVEHRCGPARVGRSSV